MPKVNVYLPDNLATAVREAGIPLSAVCQAALEQEVRKVQAAKEATSDLEQVAARLRATMDEEEAEEEVEGRSDGIAWAREYATARELRELVEDFEPGRGGDFGDGHSLLDFSGAKHGEVVISVGHEDNAYWRGFVDGAEEVYRAVTPLL
jgi:post-segregation antitoxin (ccd killing protein)